MASRSHEMRDQPHLLDAFLDEPRQWHLAAMKCETATLYSAVAQICVRQWHLAAMKCETLWHVRIMEPGPSRERQPTPQMWVRNFPLPSEKKH